MKFALGAMHHMQAPEDIVVLTRELITAEGPDMFLRAAEHKSRDSDYEWLPGESMIWVAEDSTQIVISGPVDFAERMKEALELVDKLPNHRAIILDNIREIYACRRSTWM